MRITFLGTSSGAPTRSRNVSALALQLIQQGTLWLFDCGEGTQYQFLRSPLRLSQLQRIFITHLHGDHLFGLPGLLASRSLHAGGATPVTVYGPAGIVEFVRATMDLSQTRPGYPIAVEQVRPGIVCETESHVVSCTPSRHRIESFAYAIEERPQPGRFDVERARELGIPEGPLYGRLKAGQTVDMPDGRVIAGGELVGPTRAGRKMVYTGDTMQSDRVTALAAGADVLIHESTYAEEDAGLAIRGAHSTTRVAAEAAKSAGVRTLLLTHFSSRYESEGAGQLERMLAEARDIFPETYLARDFWTYELGRRPE